MIRLGQATISLERREAFRDGQPLRVGGRAFEILSVLMQADGRIVSKDELITQVWPNTIVEENNLQVQISSLRKLLGEKQLIQTVPRRGYRLLKEREPPLPSFHPMVPGPLAPQDQEAIDPDSVPVFIVDDEASVRTALSRLLRAEGIAHRIFASAEELLGADLGIGPACLLLDISLPEATGLELQSTLGQRGHPWPVIFMTGFGTIPMSVQAMKAGAVEFLTKPFNDDQLLDILRTTRQRAATAFVQWQRIQSARQRAVLLTPREREVLPLIVAGLSNKHIANRLGTSEITAKVHRKHIMEKMQTRSLVSLVSLYGLISAEPAPAMQGSS
ncbi:FixJ family two-component response regulator [Pseudomonas sp. Tn43]|uniref:response regulator n=1 Tax=unclassified Pseudomonas TaxID=196821 RepID=UPI000BAB82C6|nr:MULTISPECIES: response regulator [unclassified Pseudomonas]MBB3238546.1 FixJ family two-component response regulator [Pseudomonas sp. Tn43]PAU63360.1 LuxR family transcriptional regulator [Pseudomonas sp. PICF141]